MLLPLAIAVFSAAIFVFFSQEFIRAIKKILAIKGANLIIPLALASWVIYSFDYWFLWLIIYYREVLRQLLALLMYAIPYQPVALILLLTLISIVPVFVLDWLSRKRTFKPYPYPYLTSTIIWITTSLLIVL